MFVAALLLACVFVRGASGGTTDWVRASPLTEVLRHSAGLHLRRTTRLCGRAWWLRRCGATLASIAPWSWSESGEGRCDAHSHGRPLSGSVCDLCPLLTPIFRF